MNNFLLPHPPATIEQMQAAVIDWRNAAAHERFRIDNNLCFGCTSTAEHNANLYDSTADAIQRDIDAASKAKGGQS